MKPFWVACVWVGIEPVSNSILLEQVAQARDQDTWHALLEQALVGLNCTVAQQEGLSATCLERIEKAERVVPKMQATIAFGRVPLGCG